MLDIEISSTGIRSEVVDEIKAAIIPFRGDPFQGTRTRHVIDDGVEVSDMEAEAARRAMKSAGVRSDEIDLVIVASLVPDALSPSNAPAVQAKCEITNA